MHFCALHFVMGPEVVPVHPLVCGDRGLVPVKELFKLFPIGEAVGAIGEDNDAVAVKPEETVKSIDCSLAIAEGRIWFLNLLDPRLFHYPDSLPVAGEPLKKVIPLYVAVVIGTWHIGRIEIHQINAFRILTENIRPFYAMENPTVEYDGVDPIFETTS